MALSIESLELPGRPTFYGQAFPPVHANSASDTTLDEVTTWVSQRAESLLGDAEQQGAVLFRGFPVHSAEDFDRFVSAFPLDNFPYKESLSNAVRVNLTSRVFTANEAPADVPILLHHEMAQTPVYPSKLFFYCEQPAVQGGETPLCRSDALLDALREQVPKFVEDCERKGLTYTNVMPASPDAQSGMGRSWRDTFRSTTIEEAEQRMRQLGYTWQWEDDGSLRATTPVLPAVKDLASGRKSFFNQLIAAARGWKDARNDPSKSVRYGDGSPLDPQAVALAATLSEQFTFDMPWQAGDVVLVDNFVTMHGRRTFQGKRRILASLVK